ncbi:hypothetical protein BDW02DRAFT_503371 [Decorospora gaudefroyi]|uniref:Uncharacterized protein n=1 Tax=Decorospora gaudefroyi TaxID=184978 RepID=A0A6A5K652_9PLEO|nr:hypothetical protein BDW02DRAFT_503371 [Decorospora gaudefroyi]
MSTTSPHPNPRTSLLTTWRTHKRESNPIKHLAMLTLEVIALSTTMLLLPALLHAGVQTLDQLYELLSRRAQSPYLHTSSSSILLATLILCAWHVWIGRLAFLTVLEGGSRYGSAAVSWGRVLGRVVVPLLLVGLGGLFVGRVVDCVVNGRVRVTPNEVDMGEVMGQLYGLG